MAAMAPATDILRFATAGSVDDGKSSLIGRLLYDSKAILEDQLSAIEHASHQRGSEQLELALLTDGLRAEREQNITIDVAYRYFSTPRRKFIIADTPGHVQYTRNMVTGTSTADVSVILVDARKGVLTQGKRHAAISTLLGVSHLVVAVNKMDLVDFDEAVFRRIEAEFRSFLDRLESPPATFIPISALLGDNVVDPSEHTPWYLGLPLLEFLEGLQVSNHKATAFRLPVQCVVRPHQDYRGLAGQVEGGSIRVGDEISVAGSGVASRVATIHVAGETAQVASHGDPAVISFEDEIDVSRGDILVSPDSPPTVADRIEAIVCWFSEAPLEVGRRYTLLHTTKRIPAVAERVIHRVDADTLDYLPSTGLGMNDIGQVVLRTAGPLTFDSYRDNRVTGSFVLVDPGTNATVGAGMIQEAWRGEFLGKHREGRILWLPRTAASTAEMLESLRAAGHSVVHLDSSLLPNQTVAAQIASSIADQGFGVLVSGFIASGPQVDAGIRLNASSEYRDVVAALTSDL
jgi:bifunctional enzyme CysN/CysC